MVKFGKCQEMFEASFWIVLIHLEYPTNVQLALWRVDRPLRDRFRSAFLGQHLLSVVLVDLSSLNPTIDDKIQDKLYDSSQLQDKELVKILGFPWGAYATALKSIIKITAPSSGGSSGSTAFASHNALICECFIIVSVKTASTNQTGLPTGAVPIFCAVVSQKSSFEVANLVRTMLLAVI